MRKKKQEKKQNAKSKIEFIRSVCNKSCKLCDIDTGEFKGKDSPDLFCYDFFYVMAPQTFLSNILPKTRKTGFWAHNIEEEVPTIDECNEFAALFCKGGFCKTSDFVEGICTNIEFCLGLFRDYVVSDGGAFPEDDDEDLTEQSDDKFFSNVWDGVDTSGAGWNRFEQVAEDAIYGKNGGKCKKRGKQKAVENKKQNKATKKRNKKDRKQGKHVHITVTRPAVDRTPKPTFFTNMSEDQLQKIFGNENNDIKQAEAGKGTG